MAASDEERPRRNGRNGDKLSIPLPFEEAVKAATEVPADKLPPPPSKQRPRRKKPAKS